MTYEIICPACEGRALMLDPKSAVGNLIDCDKCGGRGLIYEEEYTDTEMFIYDQI